MHPETHAFFKTSIVALAAIGLAACGNLSKNIANDGSHAEELVWPAPDKTTPMHKGGTSPALDSLRNIRAGMEKSQIAELIGYPHFSEGIAGGVREWNYLFHLNGANGIQQCQYKVLFDKDKLAQSFYWQPASCAELLQEPAAPVEVAAATFTLSADALFDFDRAELRPEGRESLDNLASGILGQSGQIDSIRILGYTDPLGGEAYNRLLSQQRAYAALQYLASKGVPEQLMTAAGLGESNLVKTDCSEASHAVQVACLAPNRRIEVQVFGSESPDGGQ